MDNRNNNFIYDSLFQSSLAQIGNTPAQSKLLWWDDTIIGTGTCLQQIAADITAGTKSSACKIITGASGAGTYREQVIYFPNHLEYDMFKDVLSFGIWIRQTVANSGQLTIELLDRNFVVSNIFNANVSAFNAVAGSDINKWVQLKVENISMPHAPSVIASFECVVAIRFKFKNNINNSTVEFSQPMVNIGSTVNEFQERVHTDWHRYSGLEDLVYKLINKKPIQIGVYGDSIYGGTITSQTDVTNLPNAASSMRNLLVSKFGITVTHRNNSSQGNAFANALINFFKWSVSTPDDLVIFGHGRNIPAQTYNGTWYENFPLLEGMIRRLKTASPKMNFILTLPFFRRLELGGLGDVNGAQHEIDKAMIADMQYLNQYYGGASSYGEEKLRAWGEKGGWRAIFATATAGGESTHPFWVGHNFQPYETRHILWGSMLGLRAKPYYTPSAINPISALAENSTTLFPSQFGTAGTYQDGSGLIITVGTPIGTLAPDPNIDATQISTNKKFVGAGTKAGNTAFGWNEVASYTNNQGDGTGVISGTFKYFAINFVHANDRGNALITVNGTPYTLNTNDPSATITKHTFPTFTNFLTGANPSALVALPAGTNTIQITQKDNVANSSISIASIVLF